MTPIDFKKRVQQVAAEVEHAGCSAYLSTRQASLHWLSGAFMPWHGAVIVTARGQCEFVYWAMDASRAREESWGAPLHEFWFDGFVTTIADRLRDLGCDSGSIGVDLSHPGAAQIAPGMLTAAEFMELQAALPKAEFVNGVDLVDNAMLLKTPAEIERLRKVAEVSDLGFRAGLNAIREGVTENFIAGQIEAAIRLHGSNWAWAVTGGTEVGAGERTAYLRGVSQQATDRRIGVDEFVILDLHPMLDLYLADTALPVFHGKPNPQQQRLIDCWEDTVQTMLDSLQPGRPIPDCVNDGIRTMEKHGMREFGLPLFGHGLGTCARTRPFINLRSKDIVQPGMVVALGTHIYQPGVGGCRLEYPVLVGENGSIPLVSTPARVHLIDAR